MDAEKNSLHYSTCFPLPIAWDRFCSKHLSWNFMSHTLNESMKKRYEMFLWHHQNWFSVIQWHTCNTYKAYRKLSFQTRTALCKFSSWPCDSGISACLAVQEEKKTFLLLRKLNSLTRHFSEGLSLLRLRNYSLTLLLPCHCSRYWTITQSMNAIIF